MLGGIGGRERVIRRGGWGGRREYGKIISELAKKRKTVKQRKGVSGRFNAKSNSSVKLKYILIIRAKRSFKRLYQDYTT